MFSQWQCTKGIITMSVVQRGGKIPTKTLTSRKYSLLTIWGGIRILKQVSQSKSDIFSLISNDVKKILNQIKHSSL